MNQKFLFALFCLTWLLGGCASSSKNEIPPNGAVIKLGGIPGIPKPGITLLPRAKVYTGEILPVIQHLLPKSVAENYKFRVGDQIAKLNDEQILSAAQFDHSIKSAPTLSTIYFRRGGKLSMIKVKLGVERPRFGAGFEPEGVALVKKSSPFISYMHKNDITAFTQTSVNEEKTLLHFNVILNSTKIIPAAHLKYSVFDRGIKKSVATGTEIIDALGPNSKVLKKAFRKNSHFKGPFSVALEVEGKQFRFEFQ